jgi:acyl dehydratase
MSLTPGQRATRSLALGPDKVRAFAELTGDYNPLHFDEAFAARTPFVACTLTTSASAVIVSPM